MTDNYERMEIDGSTYVMIPEHLWDSEQVDTQTEPNPAWLDYILADNTPVRANMGLYANVLLPLGNLMRMDDTFDADQIPALVSRSLRSLLSVIWEAESDWLPQAQAVEGWYFDPAKVLSCFSRAIGAQNGESVRTALKEASDEYAIWLNMMLNDNEEDTNV